MLLTAYNAESAHYVKNVIFVAEMAWSFVIYKTILQLQREGLVFILASTLISFSTVLFTHTLAICYDLLTM